MSLTLWSDIHDRMPESGLQPCGINLDQVLVVVPVLNEATTIGPVIQSLRRQGLQNIRVIDNGSTDESAAIARDSEAEVISETQRGYGQACWTGLQHIPPEIDWILFCDGDGSDDLTQLDSFWQVANSADLVLANRRYSSASKQKLTLPQNFGNALAVQLIQWGWGHSYQDLGPLRLIRRSALEQLNMQDRAFGWTVEMQVKAVQEGLRIREIPMPYGDRQGGQSKISGTVQGVIKAGLGILLTLGSLYWQRQANSDTPPHRRILLSIILLVMGASIIQPQGAFDSPESFRLFGAGIGMMLVGFVLSWMLPQISALWFWAGAVIPRLILLPMAAGDDVWRYLWEGYLPSVGVSPYALPPNAEVLIPFRTPWWELMNHHDTSAIYPPVAQLGFQILAQLSLTVVMFKLGFVLADLAICWILSRRFGCQATLIYAWNPLVIYAFAGGAHYDSWFVLPIVLAWLCAENRHWLKSAIWIGVSIGVKWVSLPLLAFLAWQTRWRKALVVVAIAAIPLLVTVPRFCQLGSCALIPTQSSFVVNGRSAEVFPHLLAYLWPASVGMNWIFALPLGLAILWLLRSQTSFGAYAERYFWALLLIAPVIHAWYFTWLIPFCVASRNLGAKLLSISGFIYFLLPYRQFAGLETQRWYLSSFERSILWLPFLIGCVLSLYVSKRYPMLQRSSPTHL